MTARDIIQIPEVELLQDLAESYADVIACEAALRVGVVTYAGGESVSKRLETNRQIIAKIETELQRRKPETYMARSGKYQTEMGIPD